MSPSGENPELDLGTRERRNIKKKLGAILNIPLGYIQAYSFSQSRGSNLQNAMELGLDNYRPPDQSNKTPNLGVLINPSSKGEHSILGDSDINKVISGIGMFYFGNKAFDQLTNNTYGAKSDDSTYLFLAGSMLVNSRLPALDQDTITRTGLDAELNGNPLPIISFNGRSTRAEFAPYYPATNEYQFGGVQPGNSFLQQAVIDFKKWWVAFSQPAKDLKITDSNDPRIDAYVPKKFILITHSMGNESARLFIYSNELAAQGKFFKQGFYKGNVEKAVFVAPPLEGSDVAELAPFSPAAEVLMKSLGTMDEALAIKKDFDTGDPLSRFASRRAAEFVKMTTQLQNPYLVTIKPLYPMEMSAKFLKYFIDFKENTKPNSSMEGYFGVRGKTPGWTPAAAELQPKSELLNALKHVEKASDQQEPNYSIVYGSGAPGLHTGESLTWLPIKMVSGFFDFGPDVATMYLASPLYNSLPTPGSRLLSWYEFYNKGEFFQFHSNGDYAVPVWSARGENIPYLKNAKRIEKQLSPGHINDFATSLPVLIGGIESLWLMPYAWPAIPYIRFGLVALTADEYIQNHDEITTFMQAHSEMYGAHEEIIKGLLDTPELAISDSQYVHNAIVPQIHTQWAGVYVPTTNQHLASFSIQGRGSSTPNFYTQAAELSPILNDTPRAIGLTISGNEQRIEAIALSDDEVVIRGLIRDFAPKMMPEISYSFNFSGWTSFQNKVLDDGRFELGPLKLSEGQNLIGFKLVNYAGYSSNQVLKILKTGIAVQPVLDALQPAPDSVSSNRALAMHLVYQNKKYSDTIANGIRLNSISISKRTASDSEVTHFATLQAVPVLNYESVGTASIAFERYREQLIRDRSGLNRLEVDFPLTVTADGTYDLVSRATDDYGTSSYLRYSFVIDSTSPTISVAPISPQNLMAGESNSTPGIKIQFFTSDNLSVNLKRQHASIRNSNHEVVFESDASDTRIGAHQMDWKIDHPEQVSDGRYELLVQAEDEAGNLTESRSEFDIDRQPPQLTTIHSEKEVYSSLDPTGKLQITASEPILGIVTISDKNGGYSQSIPFPSPSMTDSSISSESPSTNYLLDLPVNDVPSGDSQIQYQITARDLAGNVTIATGNYRIDKTGPTIASFSVNPMILSSGRDHQVTALFSVQNQSQFAGTSNQAAVTLNIMDGKTGALLKTETRRVSTGETNSISFSTDDLAKGSYRLSIQVADEFGNSSLGGIDFLKDGTDPVISSPMEGDFVEGPVAIRGTVMDPDLRNTKGLKRFILGYKKGRFSTVSANDFDSFIQNSAVLSVPSRHRRGTFSAGLAENMGSSEIRVIDTLGYLNPSLLDDKSEYTIAVAAEEDGIGITSVASKTLYIQKSAAANEVPLSMGHLQLIAPPTRNTISESNTTIPFGFKITDGEASVCLEVVNTTTQKVVFDRQFSSVTGPNYLGIPTRKVVAPGVYVYQATPSSSFTILAKTDGTPHVFNFTLLAHGGSIRTVNGDGFNFQPSEALLGGAIGQIHLSVNANSEKKFTFTCDGTGVTLNTQLDNDLMSMMQMKDATFIGKSAQSTGQFPTTIQFMPVPQILVDWDGKLSHSTGLVDSGVYELRATAEGPNGNGIQTYSVTFNVATPADISVSGTSRDTILIDPFTRQETVSLKYQVNKTCETTARILSQSGQPLQTLKLSEITHPTDSDNPYLVTWD